MPPVSPVVDTSTGARVSRGDSPTNILITAATAEAPPSHGPLEGFALVVKDIIDVAGFPTTNGSAHFDPAPLGASAPVVEALVSAGAHVVGKANLDEFAWGVTGENLRWGRVPNPQFAGLVAGGSSGGTAAAIASGIARIGLGTDTAGSVRIPAAACALVGFRPRNGQLSTAGAHPLAPTFDVIGPMAHSVADVKLMWDVLSPQSAAAAPSLQDSLRLGVMEDLPSAQRFAELGAATYAVPTPREVLAPFWKIMRSEAYATHRDQFERNPQVFGPGVRGKLAAAKLISPADAHDARAELAELRRVLGLQLAEFDAIILPSVGCPTPPAGVREESIRDAYGWPAAMISALNLAAVSIGNLQIAARTESRALDIAMIWEQRVGGFPQS